MNALTERVFGEFKLICEDATKWIVEIPKGSALTCTPRDAPQSADVDFVPTFAGKRRADSQSNDVVDDVDDDDLAVPRTWKRLAKTRAASPPQPARPLAPPPAAAAEGRSRAGVATEKTGKTAETAKKGRNARLLPSKKSSHRAKKRRMASSCSPKKQARRSKRAATSAKPPPPAPPPPAAVVVVVDESESEASSGVGSSSGDEDDDDDEDDNDDNNNDNGDNSDPSFETDEAAARALDAAMQALDANSGSIMPLKWTHVRRRRPEDDDADVVVLRDARGARLDAETCDIMSVAFACLPCGEVLAPGHPGLFAFAFREGDCKALQYAPGHVEEFYKGKRSSNTDVQLRIRFLLEDAQFWAYGDSGESLFLDDIYDKFPASSAQFSVHLATRALREKIMSRYKSVLNRWTADNRQQVGLWRAPPSLAPASSSPRSPIPPPSSSSSSSSSSPSFSSSSSCSSSSWSFSSSLSSSSSSSSSSSLSSSSSSSSSSSPSSPSFALPFASSSSCSSFSRAPFPPPPSSFGSRRRRGADDDEGALGVDEPSRALSVHDFLEMHCARDQWPWRTALGLHLFHKYVMPLATFGLHPRFDLVSRAMSAAEFDLTPVDGRDAEWHGSCDACGKRDVVLRAHLTGGGATTAENPASPRWEEEEPGGSADNSDAGAAAQEKMSFGCVCGARMACLHDIGRRVQTFRDAAFDERSFRQMYRDIDERFQQHLAEASRVQSHFAGPAASPIFA